VGIFQSNENHLIKINLEIELKCVFLFVCVFLPGWRVPFGKMLGHKTHNFITVA